MNAFSKWPTFKSVFKSMRFRSQRKRIPLKTHECEEGLRLVSRFPLFFLPIIAAVTTKSLDVCNSTCHCTVSWSTHVLVRFLIARVVWLDEKLCFTLPIYTKVYKSTFPLFSTISTSSLNSQAVRSPLPQAMRCYCSRCLWETFTN